MCGEEDRAGSGVLRGRGGVQGWRVRVEGVAGWSSGRRGRVKRAAEEEGKRERERKGEGKEKKKKMGKRKEKRKKEGREIKREREKGAGASAPIAAAVGHAWRPGAHERDARVEGKQGAGYGCRVFGESKDLAEQGSSQKNWG